MQDRKYAGVSCGDFESQYDSHLVRVRGLSQSTRNLHRLVVHKLLMATFPSGRIRWRNFRSRDVVRFVTSEFCRLHSRETQRAWLMVLRSVLRYLAEEERISGKRPGRAVLTRLERVTFEISGEVVSVHVFS